MEAILGKADLHVHTTASDGVSEIDEVLAAASNANLDVLAITDHNRVDSAIAAQEKAQRYGLDLVVGEEVSTRQGHLLGLFLHERIAPKMSYADTIAAVHEQGGLVVVPHPYDCISFGVLNPWRHSLKEEQLLQLSFDAIEGFNGCLFGTSMNKKAVQLASRAQKPVVAGSDAHSAATAARALTFFPGFTADHLRYAIENGQTQLGGHSWSLGNYVSLVSKRELSYAGSAAAYSFGLCGIAVIAAALAVSSGISF